MSVSFTYRIRIPSVDEIKSELPLNQRIETARQERDRIIAEIFECRDNRCIVIVGPCSADNEDAVCDYVNRLREVQEKTADKLVIIPRVYTNKPRTTGSGYKGMAHQPDPTEDPDLVNGLKAIRRMHLRVVSETGLSAADEMLYPGNYPYLDDILSYVAIGARSVENQHHRLAVSGLDIPCGMKNPTSGDLSVMLNSIQASQMAHTFVYNGWEVRTSGNALAHAVLRGAVNQYGRAFPNYHYEDLMYLSQLYLQRGLENPSIIVDTNHANSGKMYDQQPRIVKEVIGSIKCNDQLRSMVKGFMIESYIESGSQKVDGGGYGQSITDPCLGWPETQRLLHDIADLW
jgi:3-deoxy-7-phosphoheptulonate synthase